MITEDKGIPTSSKTRRRWKQNPVNIHELPLRDWCWII